MIHLPHLSVFGYGSDPENRSNALHSRAVDPSSMSGSGGTPPKKPHAPVKKPGKKPQPKK